MNQYQQMLTRHSKYILFILSSFIMGWGFTNYQPMFLGLILGTVVSFFNLWVMHKKINKFGHAIVKGKKVGSLGMLLRFGTASLSVFIIIKFPDLFNLVGLVIGLMTPYLVIMIDMFFNSSLVRKRGE